MCGCTAGEGAGVPLVLRSTVVTFNQVDNSHFFFSPGGEAA
jgi:hypothetical protein